MLAIFLFLLSILSVGGWLVNYFKLGKGLRLIGLAYGFGSAVITLELFFYFLIFRLSFSAWLLWFFGLQTILFLVLIFKKINWRQKFVFNLTKKHWFTLLLCLVFILVVGASLIFSISRPPLGFDAISFWSIRAKLLLINQKIDFDSNSFTYLSSFGSKYYPWHRSLIEYWLRLLGATESFVQFFSWGYFISLALLIIEAVKRWLGNWQGYAAGLFFISLPLIFYHSFNNYADLILAYYLSAAFLFFIDWLSTNDKKMLFISALLGAFSMMVKNDGLFYVVALLLTLILGKIFKLIKVNWRYCFYTLLIMVLTLLPWLTFKAFYQLGLANPEDTFGWHPGSFVALYESLFASNSWNIWWAIFIISFFVVFKTMLKNKILILSWLLFILMAGGIFAIYLFTGRYLWALDHTSLSRTLISLAPMSILLTFFSLKFLDYKNND